MKRFVFLFLVSMLILMASGFNVTAFASPVSPITIEIDGKIVGSDVAPVSENGRTLVPVNTISQNLGWDITWDAQTRQATVSSTANTVVLTVGSANYTVNNAARTLDVPARVIDGRTMIPINAVATAMGANVTYDAAARKVIVKYYSDMSGSIKISGSTTVKPVMDIVTDELIAMNGGKLTISVAGGGSGTGVNDANSGAVNIGMSSRDLTADEINGGLAPVAVANDAIAIIVHPSNSVTGLTTEQAAKIFLGEIKDWSEVGGKSAPILVQTRETGSGTLSTLEELLLDKQNVVGAATPHASATLLKQAVARAENAIGFDSLGFVDNTVKKLSLSGVTPTDATAKDGSYPLSRQLFLLTKGQATGINAVLIDYFKTSHVQTDIVQKEGYITLD